MEKDILQDIIAQKREEVARQQEAVSLDQLIRLTENLPEGRSMKQALAASPHGIIAEFKRHSPSKGWIHQEADSAVIPPAYEKAGAAALSILTDTPFFKGSLKDIRTARPLVQLPILRKDFIISPYQIYQAKAVQADAILLIAAALTPAECRTLAHTAHELHLEVLMEIHHERELDCLNEDVDIVGVNNRNPYRSWKFLPSGQSFTSRCTESFRKRPVQSGSSSEAAGRRIPGISDRRDLYADL